MVRRSTYVLGDSTSDFVSCLLLSLHFVSAARRRRRGKYPPSLPPHGQVASSTTEAFPSTYIETDLLVIFFSVNLSRICMEKRGMAGMLDAV